MVPWLGARIAVVRRLRMYVDLRGATKGLPLHTRFETSRARSLLLPRDTARAMSQENVEIVREVYAAFARRDAESALSAFDPGVVLDASHRVDGRVGHGLEEMAAIVAEWMETWDDWRQDVEEIRDLGDRVLAVTTQRGRGVESGAPWENRFAMLYEFEHDKIIRWTIYDDLDNALEAAAGLSE